MTVGGYRLLQQLGEGGMGVVHLAQDRRGRAVAIKLLRANVAGDPEARRRLAREVQTLRRVRHPRVAEVLDADVDGDPPYLVTRFVPGRTLEQYVAANGPLSSSQVVVLGRQLAEALQAIHAVGVVHRDVKPANVMLVEGNPVLIDFGIAHVADESRITMTGLVMGTPGYLSPEVVAGQQVTAATDWWGWGSTLTYAATGRPPFGTGPLEVVLERVRRGAADVQGVEPRLAAALSAALSVDPAWRPSAGQLLASLEPGNGQHGRTRTAPARTVPPAPPAAAAGWASRAAPPPAPPLPAPAARTVAYPPAPTLPATGPTWAYRSGQAPAPTRPYPVPAPSGPPGPRGVPVGPAPGGGPGGPGGSGGPGRGSDPAGQGSSRGAPAGWEPPSGEPPPVRPTGVLLAAAGSLAAVAAVAPGTAILIGLAVMIVARVVDRSATALWQRRYTMGRRAADVPITVLALPWRVAMAAISSAFALLLPLLVAGSVAFIVGSGRPNVSGPMGPSHPIALAVAALAGVFAAWIGPGSGSVRRGSRFVARKVSGPARLRLVVLGLCALVILSALLMVRNGTPPDWTPFPHLSRPAFQLNHLRGFGG